MDTVDGFYAAYLTGSGSQGFAMLIFSKGVIVGMDSGGVKYDGVYTTDEHGITATITFTIPPHTLLVQGVISGPNAERSELKLTLPFDFASRAFLRIEANHGPVNAKFTKLREIS